MAWQPGTGPWLFHSITRDFDYWPTLDSISITREEPEGIATFDARIVLAGVNEGFIFEVEDQHRVMYRGDRIWAGHLKAVSHEYLSEAGTMVVTISGQDYTAKLDDALVRRRRKRKKERMRKRIRWILRYLRRSGVWTVADVDFSDLPDDNPYIEGYDYFGNSVREALEHVADEQRLVFYIDVDNVFHIFRTDSSNAPFDLNNDDPDYVNSFPFSEYTDSDESTELGNAVLVEPEKRKHSVWRKDLASIVAYRRQERFHSDENLHRKQQAKNLGDRALAQSSEPEREVTLTCWEPGLMPTHRVGLKAIEWDIDETLIVERVQISAVDPHDSDGNAHLKSEVTLTDRRRPKRLRRSNRAINKLARRRPGETYDTDPYLLDHFGRVVESPAVEEGDPLSEAAVYYQLEWGEHAGSFSGDDNETYGEGAPFGPTLSLDHATRYVYGVAGGNNIPWPSAPCGIGPGAWAGWYETERWVDLLTVPAHPSDMAGIFVDVVMASGHGVGPSYGGIAYVLDAAPVYGRSGFPIGPVPASTTTTIFIPAAQVPDEGEHLWVGIGPGWNPSYGEFGYACGNESGGTGYRNPVFSGAYTSGRLAMNSIGNARWAVTGDDIPDLGETAVPRKAPWDEPWTWRLIGVEGAPTYGMDGSAWFVEGEGGVGIGLLGEREDDDEPYGVWSDLAFGVEIEFEVDTLGDTANIEITATGEDERMVGTLDLEADTITVYGPTSTDSGTFAFATATKYLACFDTRANKVRGKVWEGPEPTAWNAECAMDETEDDQDRIVMWIRVGAGQRVRVTRVRLMDGGGDGKRVVREWLGYTSGLERTFKTRHPFREGSLYARINGINLPAASEDGDEAEFTMGFYPKAKAPVRATYIIDLGTGD